MDLLVFAHRQEAQSFLKEDGPKPVENIEGLYQSENYFLVLTGEGLQNAMQKTSFALGLLKDKVTRVLSLGVSGSLNQEAKKGDIHSIRTIYREEDGQMSFKSFSSNDDTAKIDLISSNKRVLDSTYADYLENFASLVDRECWSVASVAKMLSLPFYSYRLISDEVGDEEICKVVKEKAPEYSQELYKFYLTKTQNSAIEGLTKELDLPSGLHFSVSMKRKLDSLLHSLEVKYNYDLEEALNKIQINKILEKECLPKKKAQMVLEEFSHLLNPHKAQVLKNIQNYLTSFESSEINIKIDKDLDSLKTIFKIQAKDQKEFNYKVSQLSKFDFEQYRSLLEGNK